MDNYKAVATLLLTPKEVAEHAAKNFRPNREVDSLLSLEFREIRSRSKLKGAIPDYKIKNAQKIYANSSVHRNYLFRHLIRKRKEICRSLNAIPNSYRLICQVEIPNRKNKKYKNIDVGFTSNGKLENRDATLIDCSIRETWEEARIRLNNKYYDPLFQKNKREEIGLKDLPLYFSYGKVYCFILVL